MTDRDDVEPVERPAPGETVWLRHLSEEELERGVRDAMPTPASGRAVVSDAAGDAAEQRAHERAKRAKFEPED